MILVWFVYGLAFFVLGLVILIYPKRESRFELARHIWMVGAFGIIHGLNEWLDMFLDIGGPLPPRLMAQARMLTLAGSFFFLVQFGVTVLSKDAERRRSWCVIPSILMAGWLMILLWSDPQNRLLAGDIWARYLLCAPGTVLTAWGLFVQVPGFRAMGLPSVTRNLAVAAATFLVYGVLAGLIVKKAGFFPARVLNYEHFVSVVGVPVQVFRALCAVVAAWSIIRVLGIFRWETQEALRISELRCATIASAMPVFLFMTDNELTVTFAQGKGLSVLALTPEQVRGRRISDAFPQGERLAENCRHALSGQESIAMVHLDGSSFEIYYCPLKDTIGTITGVMGVALDITTRVQTQKELDEYRGKLERRARQAAAGVLSATMAGQIVEPLSVTQLVLEKAVADLAGMDVPEATRSSIARSLSELSKVHDTLDRFMEIAHPGLKTAEQPVGLYQIAKRTMSVFAESAQRRKLTIAVKDMDFVPLLAVSPREIEQVFYHLIQRAVDAADGRTEHKLIVGCSTAEGHIEMSFCDTCGGIHATETQQPLDGVLRDMDGGGHGLGLAIVKQIVESHGGRITIEARPEGMTSLKVRLPVTRTY